MTLNQRFLIVLVLTLLIPSTYAQPATPSEISRIKTILRPILKSCIAEGVEYNGSGGADGYAEHVPICDERMTKASPQLENLFGGTTGTMTQASIILKDLWNEQLEILYPKALKCLAELPVMRDALIVSQDAWLNYRQREVEWIATGGGTITYIRVPRREQWITANRVMELADESKGECK